VELDAQVFPMDGLDLYANVAIERIEEEEAGVVTMDESTSLLKTNVGAMVRLPWRVDLSGHLHYVSAQTWLLRDYIADGSLKETPVAIAARTIGVLRVAGRPWADEGLEISATAWNVGSLISGEGQREHPKGQLVSGRLFGAATYRF
jgi:iron complex outermembrane receptor protein